jgi:hypothetical protein
VKNLYIRLVIVGSRTIDSIPPQHIVDVAVGVLERSIDDGKEYATLDDVPEKYREDVVQQLIEDGYEME